MTQLQRMQEEGLIDAIRAEEEEKAQSSRNMACAIFGFLVIVALLAIRS